MCFAWIRTEAWYVHEAICRNPNVQVQTVVALFISGGFHRLLRGDGGATVHTTIFFSRKPHSIHHWKACSTHNTDQRLFSAKSPWIERIE